MVTISCPEFFAPENYDNGGSRMKYIEFGPNKDKVSVIGAGCMRIAGMTEKQWYDLYKAVGRKLP